MGLKNFNIVFNNPWSTYYPGQNVSGNIVIILDSTKKIRGICARIKGEANTRWTIDKKVLDETEQWKDDTELVTGHEEYFETKYYLVGSASGPEIEIQPGEHKFPFTCALPPNLPSSFESDYGHVRYTVKATLDRPWKFDQDVKAAFTVVSPLDLNREPRAAEPIQEEMSKTFCCLCCGTPPLTVNFTAPVRGYVPGQSIPVKINVENQSGVTVDTVRIALYKVVTFRVTSPQTDTRTEEIIVTEVSKGPVEGGATVDYVQELALPPTPPSNLVNCNIIDLEYNLRVEACVTGWYHKNLSKNTLVFIGTVPLMSYQTPTAPFVGDAMKPGEIGFIDGTPSAPPAESAPIDGVVSNLYPNLPPPSYEESLYGARTLRERGESENILGLTSHFAPRYPVYNFATAQ